MLFPDGTKEEWEKFKRRLSKSISEEKNMWRLGKMKKVVSLREMWTRGISKKIGSAKANRIYEIAYKGLLRNLETVKAEIEREKIEPVEEGYVFQNLIVYGDLNLNKNVQNEVSNVGPGATGININTD